MTLAEKQELTKSLMVARELFPENKLTAQGMAIYIDVLDDSGYPLPVLTLALRKTLKTAKFFPRPADIIEAAKSLTTTITGKKMPTSGEAWEEVMKNARHDGNPSKWQYSCPAVEKAAKRFGTTEILLIPAGDGGVARGQFMRIYEQVAANEREETANREVLGNSEIGANIKKLIEHVAKTRELK